MAWPALQQISQPLIQPVAVSGQYVPAQYLYPQQQLWPGQQWPTPPPLPYDITPPPPSSANNGLVTYTDWYGNQQLAYVGDASTAGGLCRKQCQAQPDPAQCCALKARLPQCKDADCAGGVFTATKAPPFVGGDCRTWTPCALYPNREQCCASKPPGCDPGCWGVAGQLQPLLPGPLPIGPLPTAQPIYPGAVPQLTYPKTGDCRDWPSCAGMPSPALCCLAKPPGCDPACVDRAFVGAQAPQNAGATVQVAYDGSTFAEDDEAIDELYGVPAAS